MAFKDIWKDKVDGVDDVLAKDINDIAHAVIENEENKADKNLSNLEDEVLKQKIEEIGIDVDYDDTELRLRDERLKYYGDPDIIPTDDSFFEFITDDTTMSAVANVLYNEKIEELVIPYKYVNGDKTYVVESLVYTSSTHESDTNKQSIKKVIFPNANITDIGGWVFADINNIKNIIIPDSVSTIQDFAFSYSNNLEYVEISENVSSIGIYAFSIPGDIAAIPENLTIICAEGSYADKYVKENGIPVQYTNEVTKEFVLANGGKPKVITEVADTLILEDNQDAQLGEIPSLVLTMPANVETTYHSSFNFKSGETPTSLTYTDTPIIWRGDDCDEDGDFIPEANTIYEVSVKNLGTNGIVARVGAI